MLQNKNVGSRCWMDVAVGGAPPGRIVFELQWKECPRTCENFRALCAGDSGSVPGHPDVPLHYKGSRFHLAIPGFIVQGGDFTAGDGTGGYSIYGDRFADELFVRAHSGPAMLCMANSGPDTNCSQFYITLDAAQHLNGRNMVFGRVVKGMGVVRRIERCETGEGDALLEEAVVVDCGSLLPGEDDGAPLDPSDQWEDHPVDNATPPDDRTKLTAAEQIKTTGNDLFRKGQYQAAADKYMKAVRYLRAARVRQRTQQAVDADGHELRVHRLVSVRRRQPEGEDRDPEIDCSRLLKEPRRSAGKTGVLLEHGDVVAVLERCEDGDGVGEDGAAVEFCRVRLTHGNDGGAEGWVNGRDLHAHASVDEAKRHPEKSDVDALKVTCFRNRAQCYKMLGDWPGVRLSTREALKVDGGETDAKTLYRHAEALFKLGDDDDVALEFARRAQAAAGSDPAVAALVDRVRAQIKGRQQKLGRKMGEAIERLGERPPRAEVRFQDREKGKAVVIFSPARRQLTYTFDGNGRDPDSEILYDPKGPCLRFPHIIKRVNLPSDEQTLRDILTRVRDLAQDCGARHNIPAPDADAFPFRCIEP
eukprot:TRINITY_DN16506_c0_g2_i1.p1 TRINITY_DN16506_c0_g2~~TRINITY_DN16506_c0_g2_i1.p1  ORF type:complete len:589 (+),score=207.40 TRINITY_DN16506_c0_g2_i1:72-1838(+)